MCEFCTQHGEGKKWYLRLENYSQDLLDQDKRREYIADFLNGFERRIPPAVETMETLSRTPLSGAMHWYLTRQQKKDHFGQVVLVEDVEKILGMAAGVIRLPCVCRKVTTGNQNARYCYGLSLDQRLRDAVNDSFNLEILSPDQALESIRKLDREGLVHSVWTFKTPFIGGLCNCDQDCMAYRVTHERRYFQNMFRGEQIAAIDLQTCNGCKVCIRQCQFGAMRYSAANKKVLVDARACYGCGVCRAACHKGAIAMLPRQADPVAASIW
ncbi:MAG TPA: 4Fe-4S dicluster domain-containing protein [Anaerolineales bacterium]|nr:4Fe-4S dicluster domain-containing protein [Anaerolineales bacterium]